MSITKRKSKNLCDIEESSAEFAEILYEAYNRDVRAQHALGMWHENRGEREEAEKWYVMAADQGHEGSQRAYIDLKTD